MQVAATTQMPVAKRLALNFRWRVNFAEDQMPVLRINKIGIHRIDDAVKDDDEKKRKNEGRSGELDVLKSMCLWMKREVDVLTQANREMKSELEEVRRPSSGGGGSGGRNFREGVRKKPMPMPMPMPAAESPMKQWKSVGKENESGKREEKKKNGNVVAIDVENELQRAIMAAAAAPPSL